MFMLMCEFTSLILIEMKGILTMVIDMVLLFKYQIHNWLAGEGKSVLILRDVWYDKSFPFL